MATPILVDDDEQQIADLIKQMRRLRARLATGEVRGTHDEFTAAGTPETTFQLTYIPVDGTCAMFNDGLEQTEDTDYTVDYDTGLVTFVTALTTGDQVDFRYLITDWLIARSLPEETDGISDNFNRADSTTNPNPASDGGTWTVETSGASPVWGVLSNQLYLASGDTSGTRLKNLIRRDLTTVAADVAADFIGLPGGSFLAGMYCSYDPSTGDGYLLRWDGGAAAANVDRVSGGSSVFNVGATSTLTASSNSRLRLVHDGAGNLTVYQDGASVGTMTDTSGLGLLTGTWVGFYIDPRSGGYSFDNFNAS